MAAPSHERAQLQATSSESSPPTSIVEAGTLPITSLHTAQSGLSS